MRNHEITFNTKRNVVTGDVSPWRLLFERIAGREPSHSKPIATIINIMSILISSVYILEVVEARTPTLVLSPLSNCNRNY
jgi:hypothetical protein